MWWYYMYEFTGHFNSHFLQFLRNFCLGFTECECGNRGRFNIIFCIVHSYDFTYDFLYVFFVVRNYFCSKHVRFPKAITLACYANHKWRKRFVRTVHIFRCSFLINMMILSISEKFGMSIWEKERERDKERKERKKTVGNMQLHSCLIQRLTVL